ncbi:MAG: galactokinase [Ferruginibacter sp.]
MLEKIKQVFIAKYRQEPTVFRSPGRVNILGEHTDYNEGFVLPAAIDKNIYIAISKRTDNTINLYAVDFDDNFSCDVSDVKRSSTQWANYILGVVDQLQKQGFILTGFNAVVDGDVPIGAGLSSSAAVECATIFALNKMFELGLDRLQMVPLAQKAEHVFAGVNCGIMDQFASMFGKKDHVIKLDCRSLDYEYVPFKLDGYKIVLLNTNVKHNLAASEYNTRRLQCEKGIALIAKHHPGVKSLRDVSMDMLNEYVEPVDPLVYQRCRYVVEENERLLGACEDLKRGDIRALGEKMFQTHMGLSYHYDVSCKELDFLVEYVKSNPAVAGARMMGGGFGGCTINLVREEAIEKLVQDISKSYSEAMDLPLTAYIASIEDGTQICT